MSYSKTDQKLKKIITMGWLLDSCYIIEKNCKMKCKIKKDPTV